MKTGIIDVGGGFRGIYGAGVLDECLDRKIRFDYCIGISAGSANLASFLGGQKGRNYQFYMEYAFRREYAGIGNYLSKRSYVDLDYVYGALSNSDGEAPLDYETMMKNPAEFLIVACDATTGRTVYLNKSRITKDHYDFFKASSALPVVCRPYIIRGVPYFDGGIADPVPVAKAFADGCDRAVLILTRPLDTLRRQKKDRLPAKILRRTYPNAAQRLLERYRTYNDGVELAKQYASAGKLLIVAPDDCCGLSTLSRKPESLERMYVKGRRGAAAIAEFLGNAPCGV